MVPGPVTVVGERIEQGVELIGGAAILAGAFVRIAGVPLAAILLVAAITVHRFIASGAPLARRARHTPAACCHTEEDDSGALARCLCRADC